MVVDGVDAENADNIKMGRVSVLLVILVLKTSITVHSEVRVSLHLVADQPKLNEK